MHNNQTDVRHKGALVVIRDALIFTMGILAAVLIFIIAPRAQRFASGVATNAVRSDLSATAQQPMPTASAQPETTAAMLETAEPEEAPATPSAPERAAGDFSSVFPSYDTGSGADLSYQGENLKIAIHRSQANGATYFVADVWVKTIDAFQTAFAKGSYGRGLHEMPLKIAGDNGAVFAVSGDYYGAREDGVVVRNGTLFRDVMSDDACVLKKDGTLQVYHKGSFNALETFNDAIWQAWAFGPALMEDGAVCDTSSSRIKVKNPRCAIGYYEPGHYCFVVVDGRQDGYSDGMTLDELAGVFKELGCMTAYNLDGGATAMMVFNGAVVNHPTEGGRSSSDIIFFKS